MFIFRSFFALPRFVRLVDAEVRSVGGFPVGHAGQRYRRIRADIRQE